MTREGAAGRETATLTGIPSSLIEVFHDLGPNPFQPYSQDLLSYPSPPPATAPQTCREHPHLRVLPMPSLPPSVPGPVFQSPWGSNTSSFRPSSQLPSSEHPQCFLSPSLKAQGQIFCPSESSELFSESSETSTHLVE